MKIAGCCILLFNYSLTMSVDNFVEKMWKNNQFFCWQRFGNFANYKWVQQSWMPRQEWLKAENCRSLFVWGLPQDDLKKCTPVLFLCTAVFEHLFCILFYNFQALLPGPRTKWPDCQPVDFEFEPALLIRAMNAGFCFQVCLSFRK